MARLVLHHTDSGRLLRRSIETFLAFHRCQVVNATAAVAVEAKLGRLHESLRQERRSVEFTRRAGLLEQLLAQLPDNDPKGAALPLAPMGEK